jgi:hypothetical protein
MTQAARRTRLRAARNAVIYAAFSAEAYVNEFLAAHDALDDWDREPMHRKFLKGTEAAYGSPLFFADREAYPEIVELVKLRDRLAHPKPGFGVTGVHFEADAKYARLFSLPQIRGIHSDGRWRWRSARATPMAWTKWMSSPVWHGGAEKSFGSTPVGIGDYPPGTRRASDSCSDRQETK